MDAAIAREAYPGLGRTSLNPKHAVTWIEQKPAATQVLYADDVFRQLLHSAAQPKQSSGHACVKLCGFVEQCSKSSSVALREYAFTEKTSYDLFNFFVEWNEQDQHRSMRLVLDYLKISVSNNPNQDTARAIKTRILTDVVSFITLRSAKPSIKSALTALDHLVQKDLVYLSEVLDTYRLVHQIPETQAVSWDVFVAKIFAWMESKHICPVAGKLLVSIFTGPWYPDQDVRFLPDSWHRFLYFALNANIELLESVQIYVLIPLFRSDKDHSLQYLEELFSLQSLTKNKTSLDVNSMLWLAALEAGKKVGLVGEPGTGSNTSLRSNSVAHLEQELLENVLSHSIHDARSSAVSILIASPSTAKPYACSSLDLLQKHLPSFHAESDAKFRYDVLGHSRNMISRIVGAIGGLRRDYERKLKKAKKTTDEADDGLSELKLVLQRHEDFVTWYLRFLKHELVPTASYQRHITSLKVMEFILKSDLLHGNQNKTNQAELGFSLVDSTWLRSVMDRIMDPFEDVRETAATLLLLLSVSAKSEVSGLSRPILKELEEFCFRASDLASKTSRADHSDGLARSYEILCQWTTSKQDKLIIAAGIISELRAKLSAAKRDLASAVLDAPIHGCFASLRYVWQSLSATKYSQEELETADCLQIQAVDCCRTIWDTVRAVLCDDSPEGHLPEDLEEVDGLDTKDLLSYSFRAIHESSHLLRIIASNARSCGGSAFIRPSQDLFEDIGNLTFEQLSNLRHRGAFTTVSQTFTGCCQLVKCYVPATNQQESLLDQWYTGALNCIYTQASTTRRSAGIPALIVGILSSNAEQPSFHTVMTQLQEIAQEPARISETDGSNLPQVHAHNCIKDIFKSSYLSRRAEPYLTDCLRLAASSLKSEVWAIRNCGLILLRSLIDVLFGTSDSKIAMEAGWDGRTTKIPWHKYKALPRLLVNWLEMGQTTATDLSRGMASAESVFPALDIIRRAGPPQEHKEELYNIVAWYLGSHIWHVREITARTLCSFLLRPDWIGPIRDLLERSYRTANKLHGALLTFKFLLERLLHVMPDQLFEHYPEGLLSIIDEVPKRGSSFTSCSEARAVYFEIISFVNSLPNSAKMPAEKSKVRLVEVELDLSSSPDTTGPTRDSALLRSKNAETAAGFELARMEFSSQELSNFNMSAVLGDINVTCDVLETILSSGLSSGSAPYKPKAVSHIISICMTTCREAYAPEPRTLALNILATQLDKILKQDDKRTLPSKESLSELWADLQVKPINPGLGDAIIQVSGPLLASVMAQIQGHSDPLIEQWIRSWGVMMAHAGSVENGFDTRMAGIEAIQSLTTHLWPLSPPTQPPPLCHLPYLLALYDYLNDDDDEIRAVAASATTPLLGRPLVSMEAGARLLNWLGRTLSAEPSSTVSSLFRAHVTSRLVGQPQQAVERPLQPWTAAADQLADALRFDDSLFVIEEQNLYVDEVREALRWRDVLLSLLRPADAQHSDADDGAVAALADWTADGLATLTRLASSSPASGVATDAGGDDGVLGWLSKPEVFAIAARVVISGAALSSGPTRCDRVRQEMALFLEASRGARIHGLLVEMCG